jgi:hypothetical protein
MSSNPELVLWHITEFSLLMKHPNVLSVFLTRYVSLLNPELSLLREALGIQLSLQNSYLSLQLTHVHVESSAARGVDANVHRSLLDATLESYPVH